MARLPGSREERAAVIVGAALEILEAEGMDAVSMRRIAERVGIQAPSLYNHFRDKSAIKNALISYGFADLAERSEPALASKDPIGTLARAYRAFAVAHPHLYRLMHDEPLDRDQLEPGVEDRARTPALRIFGSLDLARAAWAFAHGMVILELNDRFLPEGDLEAAWEIGLSALRRAQAAAVR
jgi:AcrR family transcriptional regulator